MTKLPERVGEYRLLRHIRSGASTEIYHAVNLSHQDKRVLKVLSPKALANREKAQQLRHEFQVAGRLNHCNVLKVYEFCKTEPYAFIALEPFLGSSLRQMLLDKQRGELLEHLPQLVEQMSGALLHLHQHGWAHGSVKPSNFLINPEFDLKLIDFSLAKRIKKSKFQFWAGKHRSVGSPSYMAPEQIRGQAVDQRSDIYSLGCTLFELIEGRVPYTGASQQELISKQLNARVPRITFRSKYVTSQLVDIVLSMMAKISDHRPENMLHVYQAFQRVFSEVIPLSPSSFPAASDSNSSFHFTSTRSPTTPTKHQLPTDSQSDSKKTPAIASWRVKLNTLALRWLRWRWLYVAVVLGVLAMLIGLWWLPENDAMERQVLERFDQLVHAMEQPPQFASRGELQQYWQEIEVETQAAIALAQQQLPLGSAARPDRLELNWSANLLTRALNEAAQNNAAAPAPKPLLAIVQEHLHNASEYLKNREKQRATSALTFNNVINSPIVFWLLIAADIVGAALLLRLFLRKAKPTQS